MTHNRLLIFLRRVYIIIQVVYTKFIKVVLFSLQEFKQIDSRTSCSSSNYCTNFREKKLRKKRKKKKYLCEKPWLKRRKNLEFYETLLAELLLEEEHNYIILLRMTSENFEEIIQLIKDDKSQPLITSLIFLLSTKTSYKKNKRNFK